MGSAFDKDDFLNMKDDGKYLLRIVQDGPCIFAIHWANDVQGKARRVNCALNDCPLCAEGNKAQPKYLIAAINRERGRVQLVEFGKQVYNQIVNLRKDKDWGDPRQYDIKIDKDRSRGISNTYIVTGVPRNMGPMNQEEMLMVKDFLSRVSAEKFAQPSKVEEILRKLGRSDGGSADSSAAFRSTGASAAGRAAANIAEDDDFDFQ
jgi:predicted lipoprotein with Yx(FWY)xxD motif